MADLLFLIGSILGLSALYYLLRFLWELIPLENLENRAVFVTGCDSGFGKALALKLAKNGLPVFAGCLTQTGAETLKTESEKLKGEIRTILVNVRSDESVFGAAEFVRQHLQPNQKLWAIVNNAGIAYFQGPDAWSSLKSFQDTFEINTMGIIRGVHAFLPLLKESKGRIVTVTSMLGRMPMPGLTTYSVSKFGAEAYMDCIRRELAPFGIGCSILEPGFFKTAVIPVEKLQSQVDTAWNSLSEADKLDYGEEFKQKVVEIYTWHHENSSSIDWVVNDYFHAVTARFPRQRYRSGWDCLFKYMPTTFLPTELGDYLISKILIKNVPAIVQQNKKID